MNLKVLGEKWESLAAMMENGYHQTYYLRAINACGNTTPLTKTITLVKRSSDCAARIGGSQNNLRIDSITEVDLTGNPAGMYFIEITDGKSKALNKVVLQN